MSTVYEDNVSSLSPVIWFKFNEASGAATSSGSKTPQLDAYNTPGIGTHSPINGNCIEYRSVQSEYHYYATGSTSSNQFTGMNDGIFSIELWIKADTIATSGNQVLWTIWDRNDSDRQLGIYIRGTGVSNTGKATYFTLRNGTSYQETVSSARVDGNAWTHIVVTQNGNTTKLYINGTLETTKTDWSWTTFGWDANSNVRTAVGAGVSNYSTPTFTEYYNGFLDEYAIYSSELTSEQISNNYKAGIAAYGTAYENWVHTTQSSSYPWQYFYLASDRTSATLLPNYQSGGNEVIGNEPQWDNNEDGGNYPFVQRVTTPNTNVPSGTMRDNFASTPNIVLHPSSTNDRCAAIGWKNTTGATKNVSGTITFKLANHTGTVDGIKYYVHRNLVNATRYNLHSSGDINQNDNGTVTVTLTDYELQSNEIVYITVENDAGYVYDHTITTVNIGLRVAYTADPMLTASPHAEFKDPTITVVRNISTAADPMLTASPHAEFVDPVISTTKLVNFTTTAATVDALFVDPIVGISKDVAADPATADALSVLPAISTSSTITADPAEISNAEFVDPGFDIDESNASDVMTADGYMGNHTVKSGGLYENAVLTIDSSMYAWWKLNSTSGDTVINAGATGGDLNLAGSEGSAFAWITGVDQNGLELKSSWAGWDTNAQIQALLSNVTIAFWFKRNGLPASDSNVLFFNLDSNNNFGSTQRCRIESTDGKFHFNPIINGQTGTALVSDNDLCDNIWHHIAITRNGATFKLYIDGVENDSASNYSTAIAGTGAFNFGGSSGNFIDEVTVFDSTLTAQQVLDLYRSTNPLVLADPLEATLATFPDPLIFTSDDVSVAWLPTIVDALFVDPTITTDAIIAASPLEISNAEFIDGNIAVQKQIPADVMDSTARLTINHTGTAAWDGWDDDLTNFNKNADGWHGYVPFGFLSNSLAGQITPSMLAATWSTSGWDNPFAALNGLGIFRNTESTFGPDDDGIYAVSGINNLEDAYFSTDRIVVGINASTGRNIINYRTSTASTIPSCIGHKNIGSSTYTSQENLIKQFSYEFLFKTTDTNAVLASGGVADRTTLNGYWSEFRIENGYPVFEYIVTDPSGVKLKEFKFTGSTLVNTGEWIHLVVQTNKNDGKYQNLQGLSNTVDKFWLDPVSLNTETYNSLDIYVNGRLSSKDKFDYTDMTDDTNSVSIGNIITVGRSFNRILTASTGVSTVYYSESSASNRFTGTWAGMVQRTTDVYNTQFVGTTSQTLVNGYVALNPEDIEIMANLALRNRMKFVDANDGVTATMVNPTISTNTKKFLRLYFFGDNATNEMFGINTNLHNVVTYSAINDVSTDNDKLLNADKAFLGGAADPETDSAEVIVDTWRDNQGYKRFINLQTDVAEYNDIDAIIFADYPDDGVEWSNLMSGYSDQWVSNKYDEFLASLRQAINSGKGLYVSSSRLAADLKIISNVIKLTQDIESSVTVSDPFGDSLGDTFYDTNRNNKYKIVAQEQDLTTIPSFIMTDFISHSGDLTDDYHVKYENRPTGLQNGDKFIIPSLPLMKAQMLTDLAGDTSNRLGENTLEVFAYSSILAGRAIAELADTGYVSTIILEPGDVLDGEVINGKIIVNCVEDGLATGLDEYNYGYRQVVSLNDASENANTILWNYSTSRTTRKLEPLVISPDTKGQTYPTQGGGGPIIQAATHSSAANIRTKFDQSNETFTSGIYFDVDSEKYDLDRIPVYSMTYRGIHWLLQPSDRQGTFVGEESAVAQATFVEPANITTEINVSLPVKNVVCTPLASTADSVLVTNISAIYGNANTIILTLHHQDVITLYIEKERL